MASFKTVLNEAKVGRGWNNKLKNIDRALSLNYQNMSPWDRKLKDEVFNAYYRAYNDGDAPELSLSVSRNLVSLGLPYRAIEMFDNLVDLQKTYWETGDEDDGYYFKEAFNKKKVWESIEEMLDISIRHFIKTYPDFFGRGV